MSAIGSTDRHAWCMRQSWRCAPALTRSLITCTVDNASLDSHLVVRSMVACMEALLGVALACSWDMGAIETAAMERVAAQEQHVRVSGHDCTPNETGVVSPPKDWSQGGDDTLEKLPVGPHGDAQTSCELLTLPSIMQARDWASTSCVLSFVHVRLILGASARRLAAVALTCYSKTPRWHNHRPCSLLQARASSRHCCATCVPGPYACLLPCRRWVIRGSTS